MDYIFYESHDMGCIFNQEMWSKSHRNRYNIIILIDIIRF